MLDCAFSCLNSALTGALGASWVGSTAMGEQAKPTPAAMCSLPKRTPVRRHRSAANPAPARRQTEENAER